MIWQISLSLGADEKVSVSSSAGAQSTMPLIHVVTQVEEANV
jgi:hypothetical protein